MLDLLLFTDVFDDVLKGFAIIVQHGIAGRLDHGIGQVGGVPDFDLHQIAFDKGVEQQAAGDDEAGDGTGNRQDGAIA